MNATEKYLQYRLQISNGDIILIRRNSLLARAINWGDAKNGVNAYFDHALVVMKEGDRLLALESEAHGVRPDFLSEVVRSSIDFTILHPLVDKQRIDDAVNAAFDEGAAGIPYNYAMLPKVLLYRKLGLNLAKLGDNNHRDICSVFAAWTYGGLVPLTCYSKSKINQPFITPQDLIRFLDADQITLIANEKLD